MSCSHGSATVRDIAVIGMAIRAPEADDLDQFLANLRDGRDSIRELSADRRSRTSLPLDEDYQLNGYLDDIDNFDHAFFGISRGEAQVMAPQARLLLQVTHQAVENAGYDPGALRGRRVSVYVGDTKLEYHRLARNLDPTVVMGSHVSAMAGRISRFFGLRGASAMVDSACSSSLLAVHQAVNDLLLGDAELALACGVNLNLFGDRKTDPLDIGIRSADGKTRCFSADSDGTGSGEAVATVVLKPLDRAQRDGDPIHAVIKGVAANNVAGRSSTLTAPDGTAQADVITEAWRKAGIDPTTISYIEAHGTATRLGDPIEVEGIDLAFRRVIDQTQFCALSSVKSNIGHTWSASGIVGLVKAVLAVRHGVLFPNVHTTRLSPLIDFAGSAVTVTRELSPWTPTCGVRRAGVSSFGVMGTNVHAVIEEAPPRPEPAAPDEPPAGGYWVPVSAKSATALRANLDALRTGLERHPRPHLADVQHTLISGRGHHRHRFCVTAADLAELSMALAAPDSAGSRTGDPSGSGDGPVTALVISGRCTASAELTKALRRDHPHFDALYEECERAATTDLGTTDGDPRVERFAFQYAFYGWLRHVGLTFGHVIGEGAGKHVLDASAGRVDLAGALRRALAESDTDAAPDLGARVDRLLAKLSGSGRLLFVEAGPLATVSAALAQRGGIGHQVVAIADRADGGPAFLRDLYLAGATWDWRVTAAPGRRVELASYQFDRIRCWLPDVDVPVQEQLTDRATGTISEPPDAPDTLGAVMGVWKDILGLDTLSPDASFFDLGGDSINGLEMVNRLHNALGVELDVLSIFDYDTPTALARHLDSTGPVRAGAGGLAPGVAEGAQAAAGPRLRAVLEGVPRYVSGRRTDGGPGRYKISSNENPFPPLPGVLKAVVDAAGAMNRYPDMLASGVVEAVARHLGVPSEHVVVGAGSMSLLGHLVQVTVDDGDEVIYPWRSFDMYPIFAQLGAARIVRVPLDPRGRLDLDAMADAITARTRLILICSPNNPTGEAVRTDELTRLLDRVPGDVLVALDEAYREFARDPAVADGVTIYRDRPNVLVLRTFSKVYGLAGMRVGYAVAHPPVAEALRKAAPPFGVSAVAQEAAIASLSAHIPLMARVEELIAERTRVVAALRRQGWDLPDPQGNFVWLPVGEATDALAAAGEEAGIIVRPFARDGVRCTVAEPEANDLLIRVAARFAPATGS